MINGFDFNGKHSFRDMGMVTKIKNRPILPEPKIVVEEVPHMDGDYDFSEVNPDKRTKYKSKTIEVECSLVQRNMKYLQIRAHEVATWLACGEKQLIFDDETAVFYLARVINRLDLENQIARIGRFTLQFKCRPFSFSRIKADQPLQFGQGLMFGYGYKLDMLPYTFAVTQALAVNIYNPGTYVKPIIQINGSFESISFAANGRTLNCNAAISNAQIDIDNRKMEAVKDGTTNILNSFTEEFIELVNGDNTLQITGMSLNCTVTLLFNYLYL